MLNSEKDIEGELLGQLQELHRQLAEVREGGREGGREGKMAAVEEGERVFLKALLASS